MTTLASLLTISLACTTARILPCAELIARSMSCLLVIPMAMAMAMTVVGLPLPAATHSQMAVFGKLEMGFQCFPSLGAGDSLVGFFNRAPIKGSVGLNWNGLCPRTYLRESVL